MEYFEGEVIYYNKYSWLDNKKYEHFSYKNGNYLREDITFKQRKLGKYAGLYVYETNQFYCIKNKAGHIIPTTDYSDKVHFLFRESLEGHLVNTLSFKNLGKEIIVGVECEILEIQAEERLEGDSELGIVYYRQWVAPDLPLNPELAPKGRELYYFSDLAHYPLHCLVLKFQKLSPAGRVRQETGAVEINWKAIDNEKFNIEHYKNQGFDMPYEVSSEDERVSMSELFDFDNDSDLGFEDTSEEDKKIGIEKKQKLESKNMIDRLQVALENTLNRPLTQAEKDDPQKTLLELLKTLRPKEQIALNQQLLMHM
ncbi:hypothetical protein BKI52_08185 [marine bacterium AO1-C]|nr:hypothetical protein BKI52_08185 [marine bacterium AO1-C]